MAESSATPAESRTSAFVVAAVNVTVLLITLFAIEGGLRIVRAFRTDNKARAIARLKGIPPDAYPDRSWLVEHFQEYEPHVRWQPYGTYRAVTVAGATVNVDADGLRKTWNPAHPVDPIVIYVFGGSTVFGMGSRDEFTLPSQLSKKLAATFPDRVVVKNYGQNGANNMQGFLTLSQEIVHGRIPVIAVFYDGFNEAFSTFQTKQAATGDNGTNRQVEFNLVNRPGAVAALMFRQSATFWALQRLVEKLGTAPAWQPPNAAEQQVLAGQLLRAYQIGVTSTDALAAEYSFDTLFYWQPDVFVKAPRTPFEESMVADEPALAAFFGRLHAAVPQSSLVKNPHFRDLSSVVQNVPGTIFIDAGHVTERGNELIAARIAADLDAAIRAAIARRQTK